MPTLSSTVWAEMKSLPALSCIRVPEKFTQSPTSNGACCRGSGSVVVAPAAGAAGITNCVQYACPDLGAPRSPLAGSPAAASVKLRQPPCALVESTLGRFCCGHSESSPFGPDGSQRGTHIG